MLQSSASSTNLRSCIPHIGWDDTAYQCSLNKTSYNPPPLNLALWLRTLHNFTDSITSLTESAPRTIIQSWLLFGGFQNNLIAKGMSFTGYPKYYSAESIPPVITQNWQALAHSKLSNDSYEFIVHLASKPSGWRGKGSRSLNSKSLAMFLNFWNNIREKVIEPEFVLTPSGNIQVEWFKDNDHFVELEFQPDHQILFGLFNGKSIIEGSANIKEITPILSIQNFGPLKWSCESQ